METSINLRINAGQAKSEAEAVRQSLENLAGSAERLKGEGGWGGAAEAIRQRQEAQFQSVQQQAGYSAGGASAGAGYAGAGGTTQALKSLEMRIETLTRVSEDLTRQLEKAAEGGDAQSSFNLSSTLNNVEQERRQLIAEKAQTDGKQPDAGGGSGGGMERALKAFNISQLVGYAVSAAGIYSNYRQSMARGDYIGADVGARSGAGSMLMGAGGALAMLLGGPVGWIGGGLAALLGGSQIIKSNWLATKNAEAEAYLGQFAPASMVTRGFINNYSEKDPDDPTGKNWINNRDEDSKRYTETRGRHNDYEKHLIPYDDKLPDYLAGRHGFFDNNEAAESLMKAAAREVKGLEIGIPDLLQMAKDQAVYGATSQMAALEQASTAAHFVQSTGTDAGTAAAFVGLMARFGLHQKGESGLEEATRARKMQGMAAAQSDEFLTGLQRVIEEGISNGYVRSAQDVGQTLSMFYRLASNEDKALWQGKYGAANLSRMSAGVAGATGLGSSSDVMAFGAAQKALENMLSNMTEEERAEWKKANHYTGTYTDIMRILEKGVDADLFYAIMEEIEKMEGGNVAAVEERIRQIFSVNYTQAGQIRGMWQNRWYQDENGNWVEKTEEELKDEFNGMNGEVAVFNSNASAYQDPQNALSATEAVRGADSMRKVLEELHNKATKALDKAEENSDSWLDKLVGVINKLESAVNKMSGVFDTLEDILSGKRNITDFFKDEEKIADEETARLASLIESHATKSDKDLLNTAHVRAMNRKNLFGAIEEGDHIGALASLLSHSRVQDIFEENPDLAEILTPGREGYRRDFFHGILKRSYADGLHQDVSDMAMGTGAHRDISLDRLVETLLAILNGNITIEQIVNDH